MKRAAAANDVAKAQEALARIRTLQPDNPFLASDGPKLLADAYLGQAAEAVRRGRYQNAADTLSRAPQALGSRGELRQARARYDVLADIMRARTQPAMAGDLERMRRQLAAVRKDDAGALATLESEMKLRGQLPQGDLASLLDSLKPGQGAAATPVAPTAPAATTPTAAPGRPAPPPYATVGQGRQQGHRAPRARL